MFAYKADQVDAQRLTVNCRYPDSHNDRFRSNNGAQSRHATCNRDVGNEDSPPGAVPIPLLDNTNCNRATRTHMHSSHNT